jgi:predicted transcriptional regulator of viral defense system
VNAVRSADNIIYNQQYLYTLLSMSSVAEKTALQAIRKRGGIIRTTEALALGIHPRTLYALRDAGRITNLSRGLYQVADKQLAHPDLVAVTRLVPRGVVCLVSALAFHELTDEIPHVVYVAIPRGSRTPTIRHPPLRTFQVDREWLASGVETHTLDGVEVRITSAAKSVVDAFKYRNKIGTSVAIEALRRLVSKKGKPAEILRLAREGRIERVIRPYLEALT